MWTTSNKGHHTLDNCINFNIHLHIHMLIYVLNISFIDMFLHISYLFILSCFISYHLSFTFLLLILITVYVSSHSNVMLLILCHVICIFLSFILCFMFANTLEVDMRTIRTRRCYNHCTRQ